MTLDIDNNALRKLIPGIIHEVEGEDTLLVKISPWIDAAKDWLEENVLDPDFEPEGAAKSLAVRVIVYRAMANAVPSLDLTLSPAGYAVINTEGRAPASKERVERLIASLKSTWEECLKTLLQLLPAVQQWRESMTGRWWLSSLLQNLNDVAKSADDSDIMERYNTMRNVCDWFEKEAEERYLGRTVMQTLREALSTASPYTDLAAILKRSAIMYVNRRTEGVNRVHYPNEVWKLVRPVLSELRYYADLRTAWQDEMGELFAAEPFVNDIKGAFYF